MDNNVESWLKMQIFQSLQFERDEIEYKFQTYFNLMTRIDFERLADWFGGGTIWVLQKCI